MRTGAWRKPGSIKSENLNGEVSCGRFKVHNRLITTRNQGKNWYFIPHFANFDKSNEQQST
jgi:hypothetical protein